MTEIPDHMLDRFMRAIEDNARANENISIAMRDSRQSDGEMLKEMRALSAVTQRLADFMERSEVGRDDAVEELKKHVTDEAREGRLRSRADVGWLVMAAAAIASLGQMLGVGVAQSFEWLMKLFRH